MPTTSTSRITSIDKQGNPVYSKVAERYKANKWSRRKGRSALAIKYAKAAKEQDFKGLMS